MGAEEGVGVGSLVDVLDGLVGGRGGEVISANWEGGHRRGGEVPVLRFEKEGAGWGEEAGEGKGGSAGGMSKD